MGIAQVGFGMVFGTLNRFGYVVVGSSLLAAGALLAGQTGVAVLCLLTATGTVWWAMRQNRTERRSETYPQDRDDSDERRDRLDGEAKGMSGAMEGNL